jgi:hypothetical protein
MTYFLQQMCQVKIRFANGLMHELVAQQSLKLYVASHMREYINAVQCILIVVKLGLLYRCRNKVEHCASFVSEV